MSAFGGNIAPYPPIQNGKEKRGGLLLPADYARLLTTAERAKLATWPIARLNAATATDILNGAATTAGTYYDASPSQNFTVNSTASILLLFVRLAALHTPTAGANGQLEVVAYVDSTTRHPLSALGIAGAGGFLTGGGGSFALQGLAAGAHTIKVQVSPNLTGTTYLRAAAFPRTEFCLINIVELSP
jgi:hypothetical protein